MEVTMDRQKAIEQLSDYFPKAKKVEEGIYNFANQYCNSRYEYRDMIESVYQDKLNDILFNCTNPDTLKILVSSDPLNVANMKPSEMNPVIWSKIALRFVNSIEALKNLPTIKSYPCKVCKCTEFFYRQLQTRSADEPMTIFHICKNCQYTIKF